MPAYYSFFGSRSSESQYTNGATLRMQAIRNVLGEAGFEDASKTEFRKSSDTHLIVVGSVGAIRRILFNSNKIKFIWLDVCDTWIGSRFGRGMGMSSRLKSFPEMFLVLLVYLKYRRRLLVTYISEHDMRIDRYLFRKQKKFILPNDIEKVQITRSNVTDFIFSGDSYFYPNRLAIKNLTKELKKANWKLPKIEIYGQGWENIVNRNYFKIMPFTSSTQLYRENCVYLVPTEGGYGIKNKLVIPMSLGLRVICLRSNMVGLYHHPNITVLKKIEEFPSSMKNHLEQIFEFKSENIPVYLRSEREELKHYLRNIENQ